jgi:outer membrane protein insertion porin family
VLSALLVATPALLAPPAHAQPMAPAASPGTYNGRTITSIEVRGLRQLSSETILFYLGLEEGQVLDTADLNEKLKSLWARQLVDDITIEAFADGPDGVRLVVSVQERPILQSIEYQDMKRVSRSDVTDKILSENINVLEQSPLSIGELNRVKKVIEELYREKGYRFAEATYQLEEVQPNRYAVTFHVDEGTRVRIAEVEFTGNKVFGELRLQWMMKGTKETNLITRLFKKDIYNPAKVEEDLENIRDAYHRKGYKNVAVGDPEIEIKSKRPNAETLEKQKRRMVLTIPIDEGERWRLGEITVEGNERFTDQQLLRAFQIKSGAWLKSKKIDEALETIDNIYQNSGFIYSRVDPEIRERGDHVADIVVKVRENEQYQVGRIEFEGNSRTRDKVLRRELRLQEGYIMNSGALRNSVFKVNQLGYFQLDQEEPVAIDVNNDDKKVDLTFKGEEADRTELQFGGGWSETFGFEGQFALRTRNFLGRGETLGIQIASGRYRDIVDLSYFVPWFLDKPQTVGVRLFSQDTSFDLDQRDFSQEIKGLQLTYGRSFKLFQSMSLIYSVSQRNELFQSRVNDGLAPVRVDRSLASLRPAWVQDSRDSRFEPTRGRRISASLEFAYKLLGSDTELLRPEVSFSLFKPVSRQTLATVFAFNIETGYVENLGEIPLSPFERYYLGGENSIRGHRINSIFVRDEEGRRIIDPNFGVVLGGDQFLQLNLEYHLLLGGPLRVLWFVDAGNVWDSSVGVDLTNLRTTTGIELRLTVPVFGAPLRLIYSTNLDPIEEVRDPETGRIIIPGDNFETFQFNIGTSF